jgi:hypothetical protein
VTEHPLFRLTSEFLALLDQEGIPYMRMGGMAVRFWAVPRPTTTLT